MKTIGGVEIPLQKNYDRHNDTFIPTKGRSVMIVPFSIPEVLGIEHGCQFVVVRYLDFFCTRNNCEID